MVILALIALLIGTLAGMLAPHSGMLAVLTNATDIYLVVLMVLVGITIGFNEGIVEKLKRHTLHIIVVPTCIIVATILGGVACSFISGYPMNISTAIAAGLGWYSLSGITLENLLGVQMGSIAFLSNLMRELFSFFSIPLLSRLNYYACIAAAGATSEDTTLPLMIKYTNEETVILSVLNGAICSAFVPVLLSLCFWLSGL